MKVEQITIVPSDKTEVLVFTKKSAVSESKLCLSSSANW